MKHYIHNLIKEPFQSVLALVITAGLVLTALPHYTEAQVRLGNQEARSLLLLVREAANLAANPEIKEELQLARKFLEEANSNSGGGEETQVISFSRVRDILRKIIDEPRGERKDLLDRVANALERLDGLNAIGGVGGSVRPRVETEFGLHVATFDTLQGTVTVNLPDDMAAGDAISGTVIAEPKGKDAAEQAKNRDELSGYVVELEKQEAKPGDQSARWQIPAAATTARLVLRGKGGREVAHVPIPVDQHPGGMNRGSGKTAKSGGSGAGRDTKLTDKSELQTNSASVPAGAAFQTPTMAQAGRPLQIKGAFDGNAQSTGIMLGGRSVRVLAESPRKVVAQNPADLLGGAEIEVSEKGSVVARCRYQSVGIRLSAEKLNLLRGEQTRMTITVLGLDEASVQVSSGGDRAAASSLILPAVRLINKTPWIVSLEGGEAQAFTIDPKQVQSGGSFSTSRTLRGVQPGGFAIIANIERSQDSVAREAAARSCTSPAGEMAQGPGPNPRPEPSPGRQINPGQRPDSTSGTYQPERDASTPSTLSRPEGPLDEDGNPRRSEGSRPVNPLRGRFRVLLAGFVVNRQTRDAALEGDGVGDEVILVSHVATVDQTGNLRQIIWGNTFTSTLGQLPRNAVRAGEATQQGGLRSGDGFPSRTPWIINRTPTRNNPPAVLFEGELVQGENAVLLIPTIWEWDGPSHDSLQAAYAEFLNRERENIARRTAQFINAFQSYPVDPNGNLINSSVPIGSTVSLGRGEVNNRPIGMVHSINGRFTFFPRTLVLNYDSARRLARQDFGRGAGVIMIHIVDDPDLEGDYTLFLKIEFVS